MKTPSFLVGLASLSLAGLAQAGTFADDFESYVQGAVSLTPPPGGQTAFCAGAPAGICSVQPAAAPKYLRLTANLTQNTTTSYKLPNLDPNLEVAEFTFDFDLRIFSSATPADGFSFNFGPMPGDNGTGEGGFAMPGGLIVAWDTFNNGGEPPSIEVFANGSSVGNVLQSTIPTAFVVDNQMQSPLNFRHVRLHYDSNGLDLEITPLGGGTPVSVYNNQPTPGFLPTAGFRFGFSARTGGSTQDTFIDNVSVTTIAVTPPSTPEPIISELMADNENGLEDEDFDHPDWLEIYNGTTNVVNLDGWYLTDDAANLTKWRLPAINLPIYGYAWLFASGKDRRTVSCNHTNFQLPVTGGTVRLVKPDGVTVAHTLTYGPQDVDTSYGFFGAGITFGYLDVPTPGLRNNGMQAPGPRVTDEIVFLKQDPAVNPAAPIHTDGTITAVTNVWFKPLTTPGAEIRYTTNGSLPNIGSTLYTGAPIPVTGSRAIKARVSAPGRLPSEPSTLSLIMLGATMTNYRGSGPFKSNLPIVMLDSFTAIVDNTTNPAGPRPFRYTYAMGFDPALGTGGKASVGDIPQFSTNAGTHVRGQSSSGFAQRPYALETWDRWDDDKEVAVFNFPPGSDWVLYNPYNEETLMRNALAYQTMHNFRGIEGAMRSRLVEVFFNQNDGTVDYADYRGVYLLVEKIKRDNDRLNIEKINSCISDPALITGGYVFKKDKTPNLMPFTSTGAGQPWGAQTWEVVEPEVPSTQQRTYLQTTLQALDNSLAAATYTDPVTGYRAHIDVPSFIDNHIWVEVYKQIDGYRISGYYTKERGQKIKALPIWDYNLAAGNANYLTGSVPFGWYYTKVSPGGNYPHYSRLFQDPAFMLEYWDRFWMIRRHHLTDATVLAMIDDYSNQLRDGIATNVANSSGFPATAPPVENPVGRHFNRWPALVAYNWPNAQNFALRTTFQSEVSWLKVWMQQRLQWMEMMSNDPAPGGMIRMRPVNVHHTASRAEVYQGNVPVGYQVDLADPNGLAGTQIYYTLDGTDPRGAGGAVSGTAVAATGGAATPTTLVSTGSMWKYTDSKLSAPANDAEGDNWKSPSFNDSGWTSAASRIGFGAGPALSTRLDFTVTGKVLTSNVATLTLSSAPPWPVGTVVTVTLAPADARFDGNHTITAVSTTAPFSISYNRTNADVPQSGSTGFLGIVPSNSNYVLYTRQTFNVTGAASNYEVLGRIDADDGAVIYLNGNEVYRHNMSAPPINIDFASRAMGAVDSSGGDVSIENTMVPFRLPANVLLEGPNTIAVEVHQFAYGGPDQGAIVNNNDMYLEMELKSTVLTAGTPITFNSPGTHVLKSRIRNGTQWSPLTTSTLVVGGVPANASNIVVSEFHYHPADPTAAEIAAGFNDGNDFEYIELLNISAGAVDLTGVRLSGAADFDFTAGNIAARHVPAGQRVLIVENTAAFASRHPGVTTPIAGAFSGNLGNNGENIILTAANNSPIKNFTYDDEAPWPVAADGPQPPQPPTGNAYSLVLNNPWTNPDHNLASSWRPSSAAGGKPGQADGGTLIGSPGGDDNGNGLTNLVEHATGTSKWPATSWGTYTPPAGTEDTYFLFTFSRNLNGDGFTCIPEVSQNLTAWSPAGLTYLRSQHNGDGTSTETWRSTLPRSALPSKFQVRLRIQQVP